MGFSEKKIAVIGGGLGGMAFMNSAIHTGLRNVHLYEAAAEFTEVGAGVNITKNANRVLDTFGLGEDMLWRSSRNPPSYMEYRHYRTGEYLGQIDEFGDPKSRQIHRAHLLDVLRKKVPDEMLSTGKKLEALEWSVEQNSYILTFKDKTTTTADIVIGCDGIKSAVRKHLGFKDSPIYSGQMVYRGYVSYDDLTAETAELLHKTVNFRGPQRHVLTLPIGNDESKTSRIGIIAFMTEPLEGWTSESWLDKAPIDDLYEHVKDWTGAVQEIIAGLRKGHPDGLILKQTLYVREPTEKWFRTDTAENGIILIGDSVHSTLPHQGMETDPQKTGQGACMAIESGFALSQILQHWPSSSGDLQSALQCFQDIRKPRTDKITKTSYEAGKIASCAIPEEMWIDTFKPDVIRDRMKWVMEYDLLGDIRSKLISKEQERSESYDGDGAKGVEVRA
ncbi:hypothetical protein Plec18167_008278 [Paecilomyces lecythidis]|uniref:FAD-binding domain-containing protein n=1 Tax=Paecilomyces lecythidis TaxID=3004212 RepID=A0ABR3WXE5_9EURO